MRAFEDEEAMIKDSWLWPFADIDHQTFANASDFSFVTMKQISLLLLLLIQQDVLGWNGNFSSPYWL